MARKANDTRSLEARVWRKLYDLSAWRGEHGARRAQLNRQPLCERCLEYGLVVSAEAVDHKIPHKGNRTLFLDPANHASLCTPCHSGDKQREEKGGVARQRIGADGWPMVENKRPSGVR